MTVTKNPEQGEATTRTPEREPTTLDARYGAIGIPEVAAALPYCGNGKRSREAQVQVLRIDQRFIEVAV